MTNLSIVGQDEVGENQVTRSNVAKTQQPDAERLNKKFKFQKSYFYHSFKIQTLSDLPP